MLIRIGVVKYLPEHLVTDHVGITQAVYRSALIYRPVQIILVGIIRQTVPIQLVDLKGRTIFHKGPVFHRTGNIFIAVFGYNYPGFAIDYSADPQTAGIVR